MNSEITVTVTGNVIFSEKAISGINIIYGINMIPIAKVSLDAPFIQTTAGKDFICNPDKYKQRTTPTTFNITGKTGCLVFTGFFDGLSAQQSPGGIEYCAVFKSQFQRLLEIFPKMFGLMPGSYNPFCASEGLKVIHGDPNQIYGSIKFAGIKLSTDQPFGNFFIALLKALVDTQRNYVDLTQNVSAVSLSSLIGDVNYQNNIAEADKLFDRFVTDYIQANRIPAAQGAGALVNLIFGDDPQHLWQILLETMEFMGCAVLIGNNSLFLVPKANFLKGVASQVPKHQESPIIPNLAYPADYNSFVVNDIGYANIKACYIAAKDTSLTSNIVYNNNITSYTGSYPPKGGDPEIPDDGSSGIFVEAMDDKLLNGLMFGFTDNAEIQQRIAAGIPYADEIVLDPNNPKKAMDDSVNQQNQVSYLQNRILDQFAKIKFLQEKYTGRTGSFTSVFNPGWVPATTGTLYTRFPGLFYNFYVNTVIHDISMHAPNNGTAITSVSFDSVRSSSIAANVPGVSSVELYNYTSDTMRNLQYRWIGDVGGKILTTAV